MSTNQNNLYPKSCNYGCNTQIYWNSSVNEYWEVFKKRNIFVLIDPAMQNQQKLQQQQLIILNRLITRHPGQVNNSLNERCLIHLNICKVQ